MERHRSLAEKHAAFRLMQNLVEQIAVSKYSSGLLLQPRCRRC